MSVLRGNDIRVDVNTRPQEELAEGAKLLVRVRTRKLLSELRRGLGGDGTATPDSQTRGFMGNIEKTGMGLGVVEDREGERDEAKVARA